MYGLFNILLLLLLLFYYFIIQYFIPVFQHFHKSFRTFILHAFIGDPPPPQSTRRGLYTV
jgi:hypothetical protein